MRYRNNRRHHSGRAAETTENRYTRASAQAPITVVVEAAAHTVTVSSLPRDTARMVFHDQPAMVYDGVRLADMLRAAGVRTDSLRGPALTTRLVVEATDGYRVVPMLAGLDLSLGNRRVLLADRVDGKALPPDEAPGRLSSSATRDPRDRRVKWSGYGVS